MIKVTRVEPIMTPAVTIELDSEATRELFNWLEGADTSYVGGAPHQLWDALDDIVRLNAKESVRGQA